MRVGSAPGFGAMEGADEPPWTDSRRPGAEPTRSRPHAEHVRLPIQGLQRRTPPCGGVRDLRDAMDQNFISKPRLTEFRSCVSSLMRAR